jgi:hypothetical protein
MDKDKHIDRQAEIINDLLRQLRDHRRIVAMMCRRNANSVLFTPSEIQGCPSDNKIQFETAIWPDGSMFMRLKVNEHHSNDDDERIDAESERANAPCGICGGKGGVHEAGCLWGGE